MKQAFLIVLTALVLVSSHARADDGAGRPIVLTDRGAVRGLDTSSGWEFLGIPYATPPVGNLRWRAPLPAAPWRSPLDASQFAGHCAQATSPFGVASTTEDCLYLNVYTPGDGFAGHPVMVYIHGGALVYGESDDYDPRKLVGQGVVVVTINYRLGSLGFFATPTLTAESPLATSGNYGLDGPAGGASLGAAQHRGVRGRSGQRHHLRRVRGRPERPHPPGVAALAWSVRARNRRERLLLGDATDARRRGDGGRRLRRGRGVQQPGRRVPARRAGGHAPRKPSPSPTAYLPNVDGTVLLQSVGAAFSSGQFNRVPVIQGSNHDEFRLFVAYLFELPFGPVTAAQYPAYIAALLGSRRRYPCRGRVSAQRLREPRSRASRRRYRLGVLVQHAGGAKEPVPVRSHLGIRVRRRERASAIPAAGELPVRRLPLRRASVPVRPARDGSGPAADRRPESAVVGDGRLLDALRAPGQPELVADANLGTADLRNGSDRGAAGAHTRAVHGHRVCGRPQVRVLGGPRGSLRRQTDRGPGPSPSCASRTEHSALCDVQS